MKKIAALILVTLIAPPLRAETTGMARQTRLTSTEGAVYVNFTGDDADAFFPVQAGVPLEAGDHLKTGSDGAAEIAVDGHSIIHLSADGDMVLQSLQTDDTVFELLAGYLAARLRALKPRERMSFRTPVCVASVRGTELGVAFDGGNSADVAVFDEGSVSVRPADGSEGEVTVGPNQETSVASGGRPQPVRAHRAFAARRGLIENVRARMEPVRREWAPLSPAARQERRRAVRAGGPRKLDQLEKVRDDRRQPRRKDTEKPRAPRKPYRKHWNVGPNEKR